MLQRTNIPRHEPADVDNADVDNKVGRMVSQVYRDRRGELVDLVDYVDAVHQQARIARTREVAYQAKQFRGALRRALAGIGCRIDRFLFPPQLPVG